jgi:hypothetical protein
VPFPTVSPTHFPIHLREFKVDTMTARHVSSSPQAVVQTLFRNLLFLFFYCSLFTRRVYYLRSITSELLPLGYYPACVRSSHSKIGSRQWGHCTSWQLDWLASRWRASSSWLNPWTDSWTNDSKDAPVLFCGALSRVDNAVTGDRSRSGHGANPHRRHP